VREVNLIPFHQLGKDKYFRLSREYPLEHMKDLHSDTRGVNKIKAIKSLFESYGLNVTVG
jgi:pyruvate-formate lyase-activating enzyme